MFKVSSANSRRQGKEPAGHCGAEMLPSFRYWLAHFGGNPAMLGECGHMFNLSVTGDFDKEMTCESKKIFENIIQVILLFADF